MADRGFSNGNMAIVTDQANYLDIGSKRIQWGTQPANGSSTDTVDLPVDFANATYFPLLQPFSNINALLAFNVTTKSVGSFTVRKKNGIR